MEEANSDDEYVQLIVEGHSRIITINKQTLRDASPYFATLLQCNKKRIHLAPPANVHVDHFVAVLHSVSTNVLPKLDKSNIWDILMLSRGFLMGQLEERCSRVIRKALPALTMDDLCRLWRNAHAAKCDEFKKWFLAGIVRNLGQASHSTEFLNLEFEDLVSLLSEDEFVPLLEEDVYKALIGWCEYDAELRMTAKRLNILLAEVVWDHYDCDTIRKMAASAAPPLRSILEDIATHATERTRPKRATERHLIFGHEALKRGFRGKDRTRELLHLDCLRGTLCVWNAPAARTLCTKGTWRYLAHDLKVGHPTVIFAKKHEQYPPVDVIAIVNLMDGRARLIGNGLSGQCSMDMIMAGYNVILNWCYRKSYGFLGFSFGSWAWVRKPAPFQCEDLEGVASCPLQLAGNEETLIVHILSFVRRDESRKLVPDSVIGICNTHKDVSSAFELLPALPAPRRGSAIVQCGTFLFVTGGSGMTDDNVELAKPCYRLDLAARDRWERIADLREPRMHHCMFVKCGRVFVYGGSTLDKKHKKVALMSFETYDPYADVWTVFTIPLTSTGSGKVGSIGDTEQTTYCVDLGSALDETKYRDIDDPIY